MKIDRDPRPTQAERQGTELQPGHGRTYPHIGSLAGLWAMVGNLAHSAHNNSIDRTPGPERRPETPITFRVFTASTPPGVHQVSSPPDAREFAG